MRITSAKFIRGIIGTDDILYDGKFQVAFIGRSNVGKSTLINSLLMRKDLARSSSNPGKTIRMDFFLINDKFYFVDFPGYGYARRSVEKRNKLAKMILWYLIYSEVKNRLVILVIDAKVGITTQDREMLKTFNENKIKYIIAANKIDNLKMGQKERQIQFIREEYKDSEVIPYSSKKRHESGDLAGRVLESISG
jgi:GTP-binding protein